MSTLVSDASYLLRLSDNLLLIWFRMVVTPFLNMGPVEKMVEAVDFFQLHHQVSHVSVHLVDYVLSNNQLSW